VALATALVAALVAAPPATAKVYKPIIWAIDGPVPGGTPFKITVDTLGAEGTTLAIQVKSQNTWRTVHRQPGPKYAGMDNITITAPNFTGTLSIRATLSRGKKRVATSVTRTVEVFSDGLTPQKPYPAQIPGQAGRWFKADGHELLMGPTLIGEEAWRVVSADTLVTRPKSGWSIVLGVVNYKAKDSSGIWPDVSFEYLAADGNTYRPGNELSEGGYCRYSLDLSFKTGKPDNDLYQVAPGDYPQFYPCAVVPDGAVAGGVWKVSVLSTSLPATQYAQAAQTPNPELPVGLTPLNPYRVGQHFPIRFVYGDYELSFSPTITGPSAWQVYAAGAGRKPVAGWSAVVANVTIRNTTGNDAAPFLSVFDPNYVGNDGIRYPDDGVSKGGYCGWIPSDLYARSLPAGATMVFTVCSVVPDDAISGGVWQTGPINPFISPSSVYVQGAS